MTAAEIAPWASPAIILVLFAWLRVDLGRRIDQVNDNLGKRIDQVNDSLGKRIDQVNDSLGKRMDQLDRRMDQLDRRMDGIDERLRVLEITVAAMVGKLDLLERYVLGRNDTLPALSPSPAE